MRGKVLIMLRNAPLLLVSQYQLTSPTSLGLGFSGHSKSAIFSLFQIIWVLCWSVCAKLCRAISLFQIFSDRILNLVCCWLWYIPIWAWLRWGWQCLYCALAVAANTCPTPPAHSHKDFNQKPGNVRTMKWQVLALQRFHPTSLTPKCSVLKAQSMCILGIFPWRNCWLYLMQYKEEHPFEKRRAEGEKIRRKYPDRHKDDICIFLAFFLFQTFKSHWLLFRQR